MSIVDRLQPKALTTVKEGEPMIPSAPGKAIEELVGRVTKDLAQIVEVCNLTPGITKGDRLKISRVAEDYKNFIEVNLGAAPGEAVKEEEPVKGLDQRPVEAGIADVTLAL